MLKLTKMCLNLNCLKITFVFFVHDSSNKKFKFGTVEKNCQLCEFQRINEWKIINNVKLIVIKFESSELFSVKLHYSETTQPKEN